MLIPLYLADVLMRNSQNTQMNCMICLKKAKQYRIISDIVLREIEGAPEKVRSKVVELKEAEIVDMNDEISSLADIYIREEIITPKYYDDALHIATASYYNVDILVSWNFKHIVNYQKIHQFNVVNFREGYPMLEVRNPREVINDNE